MRDPAHFYLGLTTSGHDPALAIVNDQGEVLFAEAIERPSQIKIAWGIAPDHPQMIASAIDRFCPPGSTFTLATCWTPVKRDKLYLVPSPFMTAEQMDWVVGQNMALQEVIGAGLAFLRGKGAILRRLDFEHHLCHAASACYFTPVRDAVVTVIDGEGDVGAVSVYDLRARRLKRRWRSWGPASLGAAYGWLTDACGFDAMLGEQWKVMGLAGFGKPQEWAMDQLRRLLPFKKGRPQPCTGETVADVAAQLQSLMRRPGEPVERGADLAASGQAVYTEWADQLLRGCLDGAKPADLILTGGCALNSSYNGTAIRRLGCARLHVPPAPADDGNAVGAALLAWQADNPEADLPHGNGTPFLGSGVPQRLPRGLAGMKTGFDVEQVADPAMTAADLIAAGAIIGVMRGRAEFGPRALGHRSILADPRDPDMKDRLNRAVKGRESYRPFAPVVRECDAGRFFLDPHASPYMSLTLPWRPEMRQRYPAVVHEDGTGRLQTVRPGDFLYSVLGSSAQKGIDVLLNTSLNVMGKPIVHSVEDGLAVLAATGLDALLVEDTLIRKPV